AERRATPARSRRGRREKPNTFARRRAESSESCPSQPVVDQLAVGGAAPDDRPAAPAITASRASGRVDPIDQCAVLIRVEGKHIGALGSRNQDALAVGKGCKNWR